jgi:hypothetical protein
MKLLAAQLAAPHQQQQQVPGWQLAALQLPLLQQVVFATSKSNKSWAASTLTYIRTQHQHQQQQQLQGSVAALPHSSSSSTACTQGPLAALGVIKQLLQQWWQPQQQQQQQQQILDPVSWLDGFAEALKQQQQQQQSDATAITSSSGVSPTSPQAFAAWCNSQGCNPAVQLLLAALLQHPDAATASAAGTVVQLLLLRLPQLAPSFLPVVMQQLRQSYATAAAAAAGGAGDSSSAAAAAAGQRVQQLLVLLQAMCKDPSCAALVWRVLHPLLSAAQQQQQQQSPHIKQLGSSSSGNLLQGLAVQLSVAAWQQTGRGWGRAEAAVNGCVSLSGVLPQDRARELGRQPLELRLMRAAAVR